jgi:hypothetical protein
MDEQRKERVRQALWPTAPAVPLTAWAVLDLARDRRTHAVLLASRLDFLCLYSGRIPRELELVAPHIVELLPGHRFVDQLLDEGFGRSWGVFARIADPTALRHHLRKLLKVRDESGRTLLFRFYDPRVLGPFLRTCDAEQLRTVFGPVKSFLAEDEGGASLTEFSLTPLRQLRETVTRIDESSEPS